jgi:hypothetical protein
MNCQYMKDKITERVTGRKDEILETTAQKIRHNHNQILWER